MPRVFNIKDPEKPRDAIYIGRPSLYGNPYFIGPDGNRLQVLKKYKEHILKNKYLLSHIKEHLKGRNLVCHCKPKACHGDILLKIANEEIESE